MAVNPIPVDQRVIDIDSRRFASIEKALVELITNSDDSYSRLERAGSPGSGLIRVLYERHKGGALLIVGDQAEGMSFEQACQSLSYGSAHSPLARGEDSGRGYFGRGLKQAVYGLGHGWLETIHDGRFSRIELFRGENGGYLYEDSGGDRAATARDRQRLGLDTNGTRVAIVIENAQVNISQFRSIERAVANNVYLRDLLNRRQVELVHLRSGREIERIGPVRYEPPPAVTLLGPDLEGHFTHERNDYPFRLTLNRALEAELTPRGDERTNGLLVVAGNAVLDCQFFEFENQVGTEYLFGSVQCPALLTRLGAGGAVISDEREGLNPRDPFVGAFSQAVSRLIAPCVAAERERARHLARATTSGRTAHMIERLLTRMNRAAIQDLGLQIEPTTAAETGAGSSDALQPAPVRFTTPFYYRQPGHPFHVTLLIDPAGFAPDQMVEIDCALDEGLTIDPIPQPFRVDEVDASGRMTWTVTGERPGVRGEISVHIGTQLAWSELVITDHGSRHAHHPRPTYLHHARHRLPRDHGESLFTGYELRNLDGEPARAVYSATERRILINSGAPTVQLYIDGRGHFRDSARLLLAELFLDVIADELARRTASAHGKADDLAAQRAAKLDIIRRYGSDIHLAFQSG
jgi:hypothetical protein